MANIQVIYNTFITSPVYKGSVSWNASWDQTQAPWLRLEQTSGKIQAPMSQIVTVQAQSNGLQVGNYTATVTFTASPGNKSLALTVNLSVQPGCIDTNPIELTFTGIAGASDPQSQLVSLTNCNSSGKWSTIVTTTDGGNWLSTSPANGTLDMGNPQNVLINVSNQNAHLQAGTYQGTIVFSTGTGQITVNITFTVQVPPAELTVSPAVLNVRKNCLPNGGGWTCTAFLSSSQNAQTNLHWSANSHFVVQPVQGILSPGMAIPVVIAVPASCATTSTITFNGPDNQATLQLSCTP